MRNSRKGILASLGLMLLLAPLASVFAATEVTKISYAGTADGGVRISLATAGDVPSVSVFATANPARIVLDLAETTNLAGSDVTSVGIGAVQKYSATGADNRTRLVVDLNQSAEYDYTADHDEVVLVISGGGKASQPPSSSASAGTVYGSANSVTGVDFRRGEDGQGRVIIALNQAGADMTVDESPNRIVVDLYNTQLPESLNQRLDVIDFATPVQMIDVSPMDNGTRVTLSLMGAYEHLAYESGNSVVVEVKEQVAVAAEKEEEVKFFEEKTYEGTKVTFNFQDIPVRSVLQLIADVSDLNIVVADSVGGNLTLRLTNVPWDQALDIVMDARNLDMRKNGNVLWIGPTQEIASREQQLLKAQQDRRVLEPLQTALIPMSYAKAVDMKLLIDEESSNGSGGGIQGGGDYADSGLLSVRGAVTVDERTNTLLVTDTADRIVAIRKLILQLDYAVRQVQIESRIVIASSEFAHDLGVRFGVTAWHFGDNIGVVGSDGQVVDTINPRIDPRDDGLIDLPGYPNRYQVNLPASVANAATLGMTFLTSNLLLDLELSALQSEGEGEIISTPRVVTANQAEASIKQGVEIPYEEATSSGATSVQFKEAVLELKVIPLITPDNRISMDLNVKQDTVGQIFQTSRGGSVPSIDTREVKTTVLVSNGETIVLGGIFQDEKNSKEEKVPWLGDVPGLGYLFRRRANSTRKRELLMFITPTIVEGIPKL